MTVLSIVACGRLAERQVRQAGGLVRVEIRTDRRTS